MRGRIYYVRVGGVVIGFMGVENFNDDPCNKVSNLFGFETYDKYIDSYPGGGQPDNNISVQFIKIRQRVEKEKRVPLLLNIHEVPISYPPDTHDLKHLSWMCEDVDWINCFPTVKEMCNVMRISNEEYVSNIKYFWYCIDWHGLD